MCVCGFSFVCFFCTWLEYMDAAENVLYTSMHQESRSLKIGNGKLMTDKGYANFFGTQFAMASRAGDGTIPAEKPASVPSAPAAGVVDTEPEIIANNMEVSIHIIHGGSPKSIVYRETH